MHVKDPSSHLSFRERVHPGVSGSAFIFNHAKAALKRKKKKRMKASACLQMSLFCAFWYQLTVSQYHCGSALHLFLWCPLSVCSQILSSDWFLSSNSYLFCDSCVLPSFIFSFLPFLDFLNFSAPFCRTNILTHKMADRVSSRNKRKTTQLSSYICVDHCIVLWKHLSNHIDFITNASRRFL